jgi:hypothetical protein
VVVNDPDLESITIAPLENQAPLIVYADRVETVQITF